MRETWHEYGLRKTERLFDGFFGGSSVSLPTCPPCRPPSQCHSERSEKSLPGLGARMKRDSSPQEQVRNEDKKMAQLLNCAIGVRSQDVQGLALRSCCECNQRVEFFQGCAGIDRFGSDARAIEKI